MDFYTEEWIQKMKGKKILICEADLDNQRPIEPPRTVGWYSAKTKEFLYPRYPYGLGKDWDIIKGKQ